MHFKERRLRKQWILALTCAKNKSPFLYKNKAVSSIINIFYQINFCTFLLKYTFAR